MSGRRWSTPAQAVEIGPEHDKSDLFLFPLRRGRYSIREAHP